jgi:hypothetical protein
MPRILTKLRISEVSAVDKAAGEDCRIILMKRDDDRPRSKPHVERHARRLRKFEEIFMRKELDNMESSSATGARYNRTRLPDVIDDDDDAIDRDHDLLGDDDELDEVITKALRDHHQGHHSLSAALVQHLHDRLERRRERHGYTKRKESSPMDRTTELRAIAKAGGIIAVAKAIIDENRNYGISEHEFVALATEHAKAQHPGLTEAQAFAKLYQIPEVWRACNVLKSMPFQVDLTPLVVGGVDATHEAINNTESSEAYAQLKQIGRDRWPTASEAQQFANAFTDPANATLAQKAHRRPSATTSYEFPR